MPRSGVMFQAGALFGSMTLAENVALPLETWTRLDAASIRAIASSKLALVGLAGFEDHLPAAIFPGTAITLTVLGFNLLGDAIRDIADPRLRGSR